MSNLINALGYLRHWLFQHNLAGSVIVTVSFAHRRDYEHAKVALDADLVASGDRRERKIPNEFEAHGLSVRFITTEVRGELS